MRDDERMTSEPIPDLSDRDRSEPPRGVIYWIFRVLAGPLGILMIAVGVRDLMTGPRGSGIRGILIGLLFTFYAFTGGRFRARRPPAAAKTPEADRPPKPIE